MALPPSPLNLCALSLLSAHTRLLGDVLSGRVLVGSAPERMVDLQEGARAYASALALAHTMLGREHPNNEKIEFKLKKCQLRVEKKEKKPL